MRTSFVTNWRCTCKAFETICLYPYTIVLDENVDDEQAEDDETSITDESNEPESTTEDQSEQTTTSITKYEARSVSLREA